MQGPARPAPFVLVASGHGSMIANVNDFRPATPTQSSIVGVGQHLIRHSLFDPGEVDVFLQLLNLRRRYFGDGVVALDCGANIGVHTIEWARHMTGWGEVTALEAQERIYYALAGNIALNNCFNATAVHAAVGGEMGDILLPSLDYTAPGSFGSLELRQGEHNEAIGQAVDYAGAGKRVPLVKLDQFPMTRLDFVKMDIEGMELEALHGAVQTLTEHMPIVSLEHIKAEPGSLQAFLKDLGYRCFTLQSHVLGVHRDDPSLETVAKGLPAEVAD